MDHWRWGSRWMSELGGITGSPLESAGLLGIAVRSREATMRARHRAPSAQARDHLSMAHWAHRTISFMAQHCRVASMSHLSVVIPPRLVMRHVGLVAFRSVVFLFTSSLVSRRRVPIFRALLSSHSRKKRQQSE